jgi:hypothetical protein
MKYFTGLLSTACLLNAATVSAQDSDAVQQTLSFSTVYINFDSDNLDESGTQIFAPLQYTYSTPRWDVGIKSAYLFTERDSAFEGSSGEVSTISDTAVSGTWRAYAGSVDLFGERRVTLALNADLNLPTGEEGLSGDQKNAAFDSFLVDQDRFGEGFNVGIGFSSTIELTSETLLGFGASYLSRGEYAPDGDEPDRDLQPGDQLVATLQLLQTTDRYQFSIGYRYIDEFITGVSGQDIYDRALSHEVFASLAVAIDQQWTARASGYYATRGADRVFDPATGRLVRAEEDDNGDQFYISIGAAYQLTPRDLLALDISRRHQDENEFDEANFSFLPDLTRDEIKLSYDRQLRNDLRLDTSLAYFEVEEGNILGFDGPRYDGVRAEIGVSYVF